MITEHNSVEESKASFLEQFDDGIEGDSWMAVVWTLKDFNSGNAVDLNEYVIRKTTSNFPKGKYIGALFSLKALLDKEIAFELANVQQPLPLASHLRERNKLPGKITALHEVHDEESVEEKDPFIPEVSPFPELNDTESNHEEENKSDE